LETTLAALRADEASLAITRKIGGKDNPDLVSSLNNLGALKFEMGDLKARSPPMRRRWPSPTKSCPTPTVSA